MNKIHVVLVDDHRLFREGVASILASQPDMEVVGEGGTAEEALRLVRDRAPNVILLDINMPGGGVSAASAITEAYPDVKVMMLTASEDEEDVRAACKAGVLGYVVKGVSGRELLRAVRGASLGMCYLGLPTALTAS